MNNDFNRSASAFSQLQNGQSLPTNTQQPFVGQQQIGNYGTAQIPQMNSLLQQHPQLSHYMNAAATSVAGQQLYNAQLGQMNVQHGAGRQNDFLAMQHQINVVDRQMHVQPQNLQSYLQQPGQYVSSNQYAVQTGYQQANAYQPYNAFQQQNLYLPPQQFDHQSRLNSSNIQMTLPQQSQLSHRQVTATIPQQSLMTQLGVSAVPSSSSVIIPQIQQTSHFQSAQHASPSQSISQKQSKTHATSPIVEKTTRPYESAAKTAERAAALAAENARILKQKEEDSERDKQEYTRRENEKIQSEMRRKRQNASEFTAAMQERLDAIPEPLHLATCHTLSKVGFYLPLPNECASTSETLPIYQPYPGLAEMSATQSMTNYLTAMLNTCMGEISDLELRHDDGEINDLDLNEMSPLCRAINNVDPNALNVITMDNEELLFDSHIERVIEEELKSGNNAFQPQQINQHSLSSAGANSFRTENQPMSAEESQAQAQLRRQVISVGKQPRATQGRRKKDMVGSLYDSLTTYFDPSSRRRRAGKDGNEPNLSDDNEAATNKDGKKYGKRQKLDNELPTRSPTPEAIIHQREAEWLEREQRREEKLRKRQQEAETGEVWSNDVMAENDSLVQFMLIVDKILEQTEDADVASTDEFLTMNKNLLTDLRLEAQKLKDYRNMNKVNSERLSKLMVILERSIRDVMSEDGSLNLPFTETEDESDDALKELVYEKLCRSINAACICLTVMTSPKMPKQILLEDAIERSILLCKEICHSVLFPIFDISLKNPMNVPNKSKKAENSKKRKTSGGSDKLTPTTKFLYVRICELMTCFAELARFHTLTETTLHNLCSLSTPVFFIDSIPEIQIEAIRLLSTVFSTVSDIRRSVIQDILESLHRLPSSKNHRNCFRVTDNTWISNFAVLMLQLIQSVVKVPSKRKSEAIEETDEVQQNDITVEDAAVVESYQEAQSLAVMFLSGFLGKCAAKSEDNYRQLFEQFLQDILAALYRPQWPVTELMLTVLGNLLVKKFRSKTEISLRIACLDYLGTISARLRRDRVQARNDDKQHLDLIIKSLMSDELSESIENIDISSMTPSDKTQKLQQALIDYVIAKYAHDVDVEYTIRFYVAEWYREILTEMETVKERHRQFVEAGEATESEIRKDERRSQKLLERGEKMKSAVLCLVDKKYLRRRNQHIAKTDNVFLDSDAQWTVKYLASKREFSQSFEHYLKQITYGVSNESSVGVRTKAMRCLTQIIEADNRVLLFNDVHKAVNGRMTDVNIAVREATAELIGKYVVSRPDFLKTYYNVLIQRIVDTGVAVRKRIIRILRDIIDRHPDYENNPEIVAKIVRRISDEDGVRKLVLETLYSLWFTATHSEDALNSRITLMADSISEMIKNGYVDYMKQAVSAILKEYGDRPHLGNVCRQLVDAFVDKILQLDQEMANVENNTSGRVGEEDQNGQLDEVANSKRIAQQRLIASLTALSVFSDVNPGLLTRHAEIFLPYLAIKPSNATDSQVIGSILQMLERIVPLMDHPSDSFLHNLDDRIDDLLQTQNTSVLITSCVSCSGSIYKTFPKFCPKLFTRFAKYLEYLRMMKESPGDPTSEQKSMTLLKKVMFSVGVICRFFDIDSVMNKYAGTDAVTRIRNNFLVGENSAEEGQVRRQVLEIIGSFCAANNSQLKLISLHSLGQLTAECPEFLLDETIKRTFVDALKDRRVPIVSQALSNLNMFLIAAEERAVKSNEQFREQHEGDLKEMELGNSGLSSSIMQHYWQQVMTAYFNSSDDVRQEAANVIYQTQSQGLLTPGSAIPILIAMCTDRIPGIRNRIEVLVKQIDTNYSGMVTSKAIMGIRQSFYLQSIIRKDASDIIRGIRSIDSRPKNDLPNMSNEVQSVLNGLYSCIRSNRQQRRNFLGSVLRLFVDQSERGKKPTLQEWLFIADNLAHFSYQNLDEPLYVIYMANQSIARIGQDIMSNFRQLQTSQQVDGGEDDEFAPQVIYARMPDDKTEVYELKTETHACYLLMALKSYLMRMYNFSEQKVQEYSPSEAAKVYEKPVTRRNIAIFSPQSVFNEFNKNQATHNTIEDHFNLATHFSNFFNKLLSLEPEEAEDVQQVQEESGDAQYD